MHNYFHFINNVSPTKLRAICKLGNHVTDIYAFDPDPHFSVQLEHCLSSQVLLGSWTAHFPLLHISWSACFISGPLTPSSAQPGILWIAFQRPQPVPAVDPLILTNTLRASSGRCCYSHSTCDKTQAQKGAGICPRSQGCTSRMGTKSQLF